MNAFNAQRYFRRTEAAAPVTRADRCEKVARNLKFEYYRAYAKAKRDSIRCGTPFVYSL